MDYPFFKLREKFIRDFENAQYCHGFNKSDLCKEIKISVDELNRLLKPDTIEDKENYQFLSYMNHKLVRYLYQHRGVVDLFNKEIVSLYLKRTKHFHGFTIPEMADYCGLSIPTYTKIEKGQDYAPRSFYTAMCNLKEKDVLFPQSGLILKMEDI